MPRVTVLMPVYNAELYVSEAVASVLQQTYADYELLIIDDGSTDNTLQKLMMFDDHRIRIVKNETNMGLVHTLNRGIQLAQGEFIARMDGDDVSLPHRLERQVFYMDHHPEIGMCGSLVQLIHSGEVWALPQDPNEIKVLLMFHCTFVHPSVMIRRGLLLDHGIYYDSRYAHAEDYDLWVRLAEVSRLTNIQEVLLQYRQHDTQVSHVHKDAQHKNADRIRMRQLNSLGIIPSTWEWANHQKLCNLGYSRNGWLHKIIAQNDKYLRYPSETMRHVLSRYSRNANHR